MISKHFNKSSTWTWEQAKHLLNRAGFGGKPSELASFQELGRQESVAQLFDFKPSPLARPDWLAEYDNFSLRRERLRSEEERRKRRRLNGQRLREFQIDWLKRMSESSTPAEMFWNKMTFCWHGHFATGIQKVKMPPPLFKQLDLLHQNAIGNFRELLHGISRDPAMLRYLDNLQNRKGKPNENFARELMELFTLGTGNYTEKDVKEAARAFTGWSSDPFNFKIRKRQHDYGMKTFLGHTGRFDGEDVVNIILDQPACAVFITKKLLDFFSFNNLSEEEIQSFADNFRDNDYELKPLLEKIFLHEKFYSQNVIGSQIKSPVQLVVGTARTLGIKIENPEFFLYILNMMGQVPYQPPNVKGRPGGRTWINTSRLLTRFTFAEIISQGKIPSEIDPRSDDDFQQNKQDKTFRRMMRRRNLSIEFDPELLIDEDGADEVIDQLAAFLLSKEMTADEHSAILKNFKYKIANGTRMKALKSAIGEIMKLPQYQLS